ncbi:MAG: hypothetical protein JSR85_03100 [Proteobacteria bacterium]|nr:hypothetical protein [Pseudomonadota bacterium]
MNNTVLLQMRKIREPSTPNLRKKIKNPSKKEGEYEKRKDPPFFIDSSLPGDPCTPTALNDPRRPAAPHPHSDGDEEAPADPSRHPPVVERGYLSMSSTF